MTEINQGTETVPSTPLQVFKPCFLRADSFETSAGTVVDVYRSVLLTDDRPMYTPVAEFIAAHGLQLIAKEVRDDDQMMFGEAERLIYAPQPAEVR